MASLTVGELAQLLGLLLGAVLFITLIVVDIRKAVKKGNLWVPGHALVLSALTIQLMNFVEDRSALLNRALLDQNSNCTDVQNSNCTDVSKVQFMNFIQVQGALLYQNSKPLVAVTNRATDEVINETLYMAHCSRVMLCVLIAFFLPGMARPGYEEKWTTLAALGFSVFLHIFSELLSVSQKSGLHLVSYFFYFSNIDGVNDVWIIVSGAIISISLVWLLQLLICATIANKSIRNITLQRIPLILTNPRKNSWDAVEDQVLKSWIVARACYPESIIASSALASSAALAVTVCVVLSIVSWIVQSPVTKILAGPGFWLKFTIIIVEIFFILIGGAIISWRWFTSVVYYGRWRRKEKEWRNYFRVEKYWTKHIVELQNHIVELQKTEEFDDDGDKRANKILGCVGKCQKVLWLLLQCVLWLQRCVVFFSKGYWLLSELAFTNKLVQKIATMILSRHLGKVNREFEEYKAVLCNVHVFSETPRSVFLTNRKSIKQAKRIMEKRKEDGEKCEALISFLKHRRPPIGVDIPCLHPGTAHDQTGFKFLWKRDRDSALEMEGYFIYSRKWSWKLTAVSLINIISRLGGDSCGGDNLKVYEEARKLMDLVEESDPEINSLLSKAADRQFNALWKQKCSPAPATTMEEADAAIKELAKESENEAKKARNNDNGQDTLVDWEKLAAGITLYKICMSMDCSSGNLTELVEELQSALADIIGACIKKVGVALVENSRKWAREMEERKLLEAVYIAGKSKGLMEQLEWDPNVRIAPPTEESAMV